MNLKGGGVIIVCTFIHLKFKPLLKSEWPHHVYTQIKNSMTFQVNFKQRGDF